MRTKFVILLLGFGLLTTAGLFWLIFHRGSTRVGNQQTIAPKPREARSPVPVRVTAAPEPHPLDLSRAPVSIRPIIDLQCDPTERYQAVLLLSKTLSREELEPLFSFLMEKH